MIVMTALFALSSTKMRLLTGFTAKADGAPPMVKEAALFVPPSMILSVPSP